MRTDKLELAMIRPQTLMIAIQCVASKTRELALRLEGDDSAEAAELEQLLVSYDLAADDLRTAYASASESYDQMPAYEELLNKLP